LDERRAREIAEEKRRRSDLKLNHKKTDVSILESAENCLLEASDKIAGFIPRMEDIAECYRIQSTPQLKPPPRPRAPKKKTFAIPTPPVNQGLVGGKSCCKSPRLEYYADDSKKKEEKKKMVTPNNTDESEDSVDHGDDRK
jgi:hypothetical protein